MAHSDWIPPREQDLVNLAEKWTATLEGRSERGRGGRNARFCELVNSFQQKNAGQGQALLWYPPRGHHADNSRRAHLSAGHGRFEQYQPL